MKVGKFFNIIIIKKHVISSCTQAKSTAVSTKLSIGFTWVYSHFQHTGIGHITTGSFMGRGNQYIPAGQDSAL